jgi:hypothetical protein
MAAAPWANTCQERKEGRKEGRKEEDERGLADSGMQENDDKGTAVLLYVGWPRNKYYAKDHQKCNEPFCTTSKHINTRIGCQSSQSVSQSSVSQSV